MSPTDTNIRLAALVLLLLSGCKEDDDWRQFKIDHHCKITQRMDSSSSFTSGGHVVFNDAKVGWLCDDGITYWKDGE